MYNEDLEIEIIDELFSLLSKEFEFKTKKDLPLNEKEELLKVFFAYLNNEMVSDYIIELQNKYLKIKLNSLNKNNEDLNDNLFLTTADMLIVITDKLFGGSANINDVNNLLKIYGGYEVEQQLQLLNKQNGNVNNYKFPYIIESDNLPCKTICKILTNEHEENSAWCKDFLAALDVCLTKALKLKFNKITILVDKKFTKDFCENLFKSFKKYNKMCKKMQILTKIC